MSKVNKIFFISGPTASGKTSTSINLCKALNNEGIKSEIINFDSLLFYKELNIGTAKPTIEEMDGCKHHLIDICSAKDPINASDYLEKAEHLMNDLLANGIIPIFVGGSAFYLRAFIKGMYETTPIDDNVRKEVDETYKEKGISFIREFLKNNDLKSYNQLHENDHYRNIRAYEFYIQNDSPISEQKEKLDEQRPYDFSINRFTNINFQHIYLDLDKEDHWKLIVNRCVEMVNSGLISEVKQLLSSGFTGTEKPLQSIGYKETIQYINGEFQTEEDYIERMSISTRQLAKSQRTFFKKVVPKFCYHPINDKEDILKNAIQFALDK